MDGVPEPGFQRIRFEKVGRRPDCLVKKWIEVVIIAPGYLIAFLARDCGNLIE